MQKRRSPSAISSKVFEVAFGPGSIGLHLQRPRGNIGAYVDSFYRTGNLPGIAERLGRINIGDLIVSVNGEDVSRLQFDAIPKRIEKAKRPVVIGFERPHAEFSFVEIASDPRKVPFYLQYIMTRSDQQIEQGKLMLWLEVDQYRDQSINIPGDDHTPQATRIFEKFFNPRSTFAMTDVLPPDMQARIHGVYEMILEADGTNKQPEMRNKFRELYTEAMEWVESEISANTYADFKRSPFFFKLVGHLRWAPPFVKVTMAEILHTPRAQPYLQMYLAQQKRDNPLFAWLAISGCEESIGKVQSALADDSNSELVDSDELIACSKDVIACGLTIVDVYAAMYCSLSDLDCVDTLQKLLQRPGLRTTRSEQISYNDAKSTNDAKTFQRVLVDWNRIISSAVPAFHTNGLLDDHATLLKLCGLLCRTKTMALRELSIELYPKFLGSEPYEALLREFDEVRRTDAETFTQSFGNILQIVPDGAVLRMLRQTETPAHLSVHRKIKDMADADSPPASAPACWLIRFDTLAIERDQDVEPELALSIDTVYEIPHSEGSPRLLSDASELPTAVTAFLVPNNTLRYTHTRPSSQVTPAMPATLFNFALVTRENLRLYGSCLLLHKPISSAVSPAPIAADQPTTNTPDVQPPALVSTTTDEDEHSSNQSEVSSPHSTRTGFRAATREKLSYWQSSVKMSLTDLGSAVKDLQDTLQKRTRRDSDALSRQTSSSGNNVQPELSPTTPNTIVGGNGPADAKVAVSSHPFGLREGSFSAELLQRGVSLEEGDGVVATDVAPHGYCVLSAQPLLDTLRAPLVSAMEFSGAVDGSDADVSELLSNERIWATIRKQSLLNAPDTTDFPACDFNPHIILRSLTPRNFTTLFVAALLECKIVLKSSRLTALTVMGEFLRCLLLPFQWSHVYVPLLPQMMSMQLMQCPTPFIIGIPREYCHSESLPEDACVVDLDNDEVRVPSHLHPALHAARRLGRAIDAVCRPEFHSCDALSSHSTAFGVSNGANAVPNEPLEILKLCKQFTADLLMGLKECCYVCYDKGERIIVLNERLFDDYRKCRRRTSMFAYESSFITQFLRTQLLSHYICEHT